MADGGVVFYSFSFFQLFNYLTTCQMEQVTQLSLLHANQAVVPAATPAPGFEHLMCHPRTKRLDQKLHTAKKPGKPTKRVSLPTRFRNYSCYLVLKNRKRKMFAMSLVLKTLFVQLAAVEPKKSFLDDLYGFGGDDVEDLFNGIPDSLVFNDNRGKCKGTVQSLKSRSVFSFRCRDPNRVEFGLQIRF